jgi:hypothetical protein
MRFRFMLIAPVLVLIFTGASILCAAAPTISITKPLNGATFTQKSITATGTAVGTVEAPLDRVEVSLDQANWIMAAGTGQWSAELTLPEDGSTIYARAWDLVGDKTVTSARVNVDTTRPTGSMAIDDNAASATEPDVNLIITGTDRYGVKYMMISESQTFSDADWQDYDPLIPWMLSEGDGKKTLYIKFRDSNGWESKSYSDSIVLDTEAPTGTIVIDKGAEYTRNLTVSLALAASDAVGVVSMMLSNQNSFLGSEWITYGPSMNWQISPGEGARTVYAKFRDGALHDSLVVSDTIVLDTTAPSTTIVVNGGQAFTRYRNVTVELSATEANRVSSMQLMVGDLPNFLGVGWERFQERFGTNITLGEGLKNFHARLMDAAGNIGPTVSTKIILDQSPPQTILDDLPEVTPSPNITVRWSSNDSFSGIQWYDVQYRPLGGNWTDLLQRTSVTSTLFPGKPGLTYSFRVRAQDRAGNPENYPDAVSATVSVSLPRSQLEITTPLTRAVLKGTVTLKGSCYPQLEGKNVTKVQIKFDEGNWMPVTGTAGWTYSLDTNILTDGLHTMHARVYNGKTYSDEISTDFRVDNSVVAAGIDPAVPAVIVVVAAASGVGAFLFMKKRRMTAGAPRPGRSYHSRGHAAMQYGQQQYAVQQYPAGQYAAQQYPPQQYAAQQYTAQQYPSQQYAQPQYPSQQSPPQQYPPQQYTPQQDHSQQHAPQQYPAQQYPTQQYPQQQYAPQQYPAQQYPAQQYPQQQYAPKQDHLQQYASQQYPPQQYPSGQFPKRANAPQPSAASQHPAQTAAPPASPLNERALRVLEVLTTISADLPPELLEHELDDLAYFIVRADEGETPDGELLVNIMDHWYFGDEGKPERFMRLYK